MELKSPFVSLKEINNKSQQQQNSLIQPLTNCAETSRQSRLKPISNLRGKLVANGIEEIDENRIDELEQLGINEQQHVLDASGNDMIKITDTTELESIDSKSIKSKQQHNPIKSAIVQQNDTTTAISNSTMKMTKKEKTNDTIEPSGVNKLIKKF